MQRSVTGGGGFGAARITTARWMFERKGRGGRNERQDFLHGSGAELLVELPVVCLVLLGALVGFFAAGALEGGGFGAARIAAIGRSGHRRTV